MDKTAVYTTSGRIPDVELAAFQVLDNGQNDSGAPQGYAKDSRQVYFREVTKEQFNDFVRVNGQVQPITVVQLSPEEGGIVQEKVCLLYTSRITDGVPQTRVYKASV